MSLIQQATQRAERGCVASMMLHKNYEVVRQYVSVGDFEDKRLARAFAVIGACQVDGVNTFDTKVMEDVFEKAGLPKDLKTVLMPYVTQQPDISFARQVRKLGKLRRVHSHAMQLLALADDPGSELNDALSVYDEGLTLAARERELDAFDKVNVAVVDLVARMSKAANETSVIECGLDHLDNFGGIANGEMIVLGAYTGHGKSAFALQCAWNIATIGKKVLVCSLEMTNEQYIARMAIAYAGVAPQTMREMMLRDPLEADRMRDFSQMPAAERITLRSPQSGLGISDIERAVHCMVAANECDFLIVDHMGLVKSSGKGRYEQMTNTSNRIKQMAVAHNIPILALSQLNGRDENVVPTLASLRDSGAIEQDADQVWLLHRPDKKEEATLYIAKNRQGTTGQCELRYNGKRYAFDEVSLEDSFSDH